MSDVPFMSDTSLEAARLQWAIYRRMSLEQRLRLTFAMVESTRALVASGVRARHPEYTERQVQLAVIRLTLGDDLFARVYPNQEIAP